MAQAKKGDRVLIDFTGRLEDGTVFDSTISDAEECDCDDCGCGEGPVEIVIGDEEFIPGVEEALLGMSAGEKKTVVIPAVEGFGEYDEKMVFSVDRNQLPDDLKPEVGQELELTSDDDESFVVTVAEVNDEGITLDANHPFAGQDLTFNLELVEIR